MRRARNLLLVFALAALWAPAAGALIINGPLPITHQARVQLIQSFDDDGTNPATVFGDAAQRAAIEGFVDQIWAQAGIDILFLPVVTQWNDTFARIGTPGSNDPRPASDFDQTMINATADGVLHPDLSVLNVILVEIVPGLSQLGENSAAGRASIGNNRITQYVGDNLLGFNNGRELISSVVSHEIGHNLGLPHIVETENLMQAGGSPDQGERLNAAQIATALGSSFSQLIPEPSLLLLLAAPVLLVVRRR